MTILRIILLLMAIGFGAMLVWAQLTDDLSLSAAFMGMFETPWTMTAIADLYIGFLISAIIIMLTERKHWVGALWALPIFVLGNIVTLIWVALRLPMLVDRLRSR